MAAGGSVASMAGRCDNHHRHGGSLLTHEEAKALQLRLAVLLYREAIAGLRLYSYAPGTIEGLRYAIAALQTALPAPDDVVELRRLQQYYLKGTSVPTDPATIASGLANDLLDRNGPLWAELTSLVD